MKRRGRFAPSPSGPLHFGSLVAALASWLDARASGSEWLVRIEDVDETRTVPGADTEILRALEALGLHWDGSIVWQSRRKALYEQALADLWQTGQAYRCRCSRREVADSGMAGIDGPVYPGTCRDLRLARDVPGADRARSTPAPIRFDDAVQGRIEQDVEHEVGDFILKRRDGLHAYQLAVVVDDAEQGITDVVRGADLLLSTPRQIHLQDLLDYPTPRYLHVPLATHGGQKLSKQNFAPALDPARGPEALAAALAFLGQAPVARDSPGSMLAEAVRAWDPRRIAPVRDREVRFGDKAETSRDV